jgi:hypothetical protein
MRRGCLAAGLAVWCLAGVSGAAEPGAVERGRKALLERAYVPAAVSVRGYENAWRQWGDLKAPPANSAAAYRERYGLHPAPYPNHGYPMGLRQTSSLFGKGLANDCLLCHGGSICGQSYVGLGNASLDYQAFYEEMSRADGRSGRSPFVFSNVRGTTEAGAIAVYLISFRNPDLTFRKAPLDLDLHDDLCEDVPAWWLLHKKKTMYYTGSGDARSVRSLMQFMLSPANTAETIKKEEGTFRDIQAYIVSLRPPKYPFPIDRTLAARGERIFNDTCARCHGTYGARWTYPNKIVPIDEIGTDRARFDGLSEKAGRHYNQSWFARERSGWLGDEFAARWPVGYQAPPLDGIWATAPYFHNGAAPTVYDVLKSSTRPRIFTRSYRTDADAYDPVKLGWKVTVFDRLADPRQPPIERRKVYDTTQPGRGNGGHTFGDDLTEDERLAVIEYLKTL